MRKEDILSIVFTFILGLMVGIYVYATGFAGLAAQFSVPDAQVEYDYVVVADVYGGCDRTANCPSFRVDSTGEYHLIAFDTAGERVALKGRLSRTVRTELSRVLTIPTLTTQSQPVVPESCRSYVDGNDVIYNVTLDGAVYELNSCGTAVDLDSALWQVLSEVWEHVQVN